MRVIGGFLGGRRYNPPADKWPTRPTTDIAKEALFNILTNSLDFESIRALDLFGGSGSLSYELYSRGCTDVTYVERHQACLRFVKQQLEIFGATDEIKVIRSDVFKFLKTSKAQYDFIFCDPPYAIQRMDEIPDLILSGDMLLPEGTLVVEHDKNTSFEDHTRFDRARNYGNTIFSFFRQD